MSDPLFVAFMSPAAMEALADQLRDEFERALVVPHLALVGAALPAGDPTSRWPVAEGLRP